MKRTSKRAPGRSRGGYRAAGELRSLSTGVPSLAAARDHADSPPLARAKSQWLVGDWNALCELDADTIASHPERDRLALLVACAHQQRADHELAREYTRRAIGWGCDPKLVARLLISGVHNTLGRVAALKADDRSIDSHFTQALAVTGDSESGLATPTRAVRELADLGLLPQAAGLLLRQVSAIRQQPQRPSATHTQIQSLSDELARLQWAQPQGARIVPPQGHEKTPPGADHRSGPVDAGRLGSAQAQWQQGDWKALASMQEAQIQHHPDRAMLAMLAAAGLFQLDETESARHLTQRALQWGCDQQMLQHFMLSGISTSMAKALAVLNIEREVVAQSGRP